MLDRRQVRRTRWTEGTSTASTKTPLRFRAEIVGEASRTEFTSSVEGSGAGGASSGFSMVTSSSSTRCTCTLEKVEGARGEASRRPLFSAFSPRPSASSPSSCRERLPRIDANKRGDLAANRSATVSRRGIGEAFSLSLPFAGERLGVVGVREGEECRENFGGDDDVPMRWSLTADFCGRRGVVWRSERSCGLALGVVGERGRVTSPRGATRQDLGPDIRDRVSGDGMTTEPSSSLSHSSESTAMGSSPAIEASLRLGVAEWERGTVMSSTLASSSCSSKRACATASRHCTTCSG